MGLYARNTPETNPLSDEDRHTLEVGSKNARDIIKRRGVYTVTRPQDLPKGYSDRQRQRVPGILSKTYRPNGKTSWSFRPRDPDPDEPGRKYEQPCKAYGGPGNVLDIHPDEHVLINDVSIPVYFVEGVKKADSLRTALRAAGKVAVVVAISGVWNWLSDGAPIPDMFDIPVEGRAVTITFDSDMLSNPKVQDAVVRLAEHLRDRGAEVWITYFKDAPDGSKVGADDFFVAGGTVAELQMLTRRYDPKDFTRIHMSRDARLRAAVAGLRRRWWAYDWSQVVGTGKRPHAMRGHTCRDVAHVLVDLIARHGNVVGDEVHVSVSQYTIAERAATRQATVSAAVKHLQAEEWLEFRPSKDKEKPGTYVFRANPYQVGSESTTEQNEVFTENPYIGDTDLRAPRLRWSAPTFERDGDRVVRGYIRRLGKVAGAVADRLSREGEMHINEVAAAVRRRKRDLTRNTEHRKGLLVQMEEAGIISLDGDTVSLTDNWEEALERERELKGEVDAAERQRSDHRRKREAFRNRHKVKPSAHWANTGADGTVEDLRPADAAADRDQREPDSAYREENPAVPFVLDYVGRLGKIRLGLLEQCWLEDGGGNLAQLRAALEISGVRQMRLPEYRNAIFLYPPLEKTG